MEYKKLFSALNEWRGSEMYNVLYRGLESRLGIILEQWIDTEDTEVALRLQGGAKEIRNLLKILTPKIYIEGKRQDTIIE